MKKNEIIIILFDNRMAVPKRSISKKARSLGIFPGAKVKRGVDWNGGKQDGINIK